MSQQGALNHIQAQYKEALEKQTNEHHTQIAEIERNHQIAAFAKQQEINRIQQEHETQLKSAKDEIQLHYETEKVQLKTGLQKQHASEKAQWDAERQQQLAQHGAALQEWNRTKVGLEETIQRQTSEYNAQIASMREAFTKQQAETNRIHQEQLKNATEQIQRHHETELRRQYAQWEAQKQGYVEQYSQLDTAMQTIKKELEQLRQQHAKMQQQWQLAEQNNVELKQSHAQCGAALQKQTREYDTRIADMNKQQEERKRTHENQLKNARDEIQRHHTEKVQLEQQLQTHATEWKLASKSHEDNTMAREELKRKEHEIQKLNVQLQALQSENETIKKTSNISVHTIQELQRNNAILTAREAQIAASDREKAQEIAKIRDMCARVQNENAQLRREGAVHASDHLQLENRRLQEAAQAKAQEAAALKIELERAKEPKKIEEFTENEMVNLLSAAF